MYVERYLVERVGMNPVEIDFFYLDFKLVSIPLFYKLKGKYHQSMLQVNYWEPQSFMKINPNVYPILSNAYDEDQLSPRHTKLINELLLIAENRGLAKVNGDKVEIKLVALSKHNNERNIMDRWLVYEGLPSPVKVLNHRMGLERGEKI